MSTSHTKTWKECLEIIKSQVSEQSFKTWFEPIIPLQCTNNLLTIELPSKFFYEWIEEHYVALLNNAIKTVLGDQGQLFYTIKKEKQTGHNSIKEPSFSLNERDHIIPSNSLNPAYTFDNFIEGESNQLTKSVTRSIAKNPGKTAFNPAFIYADSGMGKTHLAQAAVLHSKEYNDQLVTLYIPAQKFAQGFIDAVRNQTLNSFTSRFKRLDLLVIDDVQDLAEKYKTQEALFYIFNDLHQSGKQIIMTSDCRPADLAGLQKRLLSRFKWGLTTDLQMPGISTRIAIIKNKLTQHNVRIDNNLIEYIAASIETNVRDIEGVVTSLIAHASLDNKPINYNLIKAILQSVVCKVQTELSLDYLQETIAAYHKLSVKDLKSKSRKREIVLARQVAMYLIKEHTNLSLKTIGKHFGGKDHSTVIYAQRSVNNLLDTDRYFRTSFESLKKIITRKNPVN